MGNHLRISRILHAGYLLECEGTRIIFYPIFENPFSKNCYAFPDIQFDLGVIQRLSLDAIFISHHHDDHFSLESLNFLDRKTPIYLFSAFEEHFALIKKLGFQKVHSIELFKTLEIGAFRIRPLEALDADVDSIYHIQAAGKNILNVVDSWIGPFVMDQLLNTQWDLILWPFQTMREIEVLSPSAAEPTSKHTQEIPPELAEQLQQLKPKAIIPSSCQFRFEEWSWYNQAFFPISYAGFTAQVHDLSPDSKVFRLNPGESLTATSNGFERSGHLPWIQAIGPQNVDYIFDPDVQPQTISEIAQKFPPLSTEQKSAVLQFCTHDLAEKLKTLPRLEAIAKNWKLVVYDHHGKAQEYLFGEPGLNLWLTEISEAKLYGALVNGESLTSIYLRVTPPAGADPLTDPLIHILYDGIIAGYQKAQLAYLAK